MQELSIQREIDLLLHPRLPPLLRSLPQVESLALFRREESEEEREIRESLGIVMPVDPTEDVLPVQANVVPNIVDQVMTEPAKTGASDPVRAMEPAPPFLLPPPPPPLPIQTSPMSTESTTSQTQAPREPAFLPTFVPKSLPPVVTMVESSSTVPKPRSVAMEEDDDEEVPTINMDSDSD